MPLKVENVSFKYADGNYNNHGSNTAAEYNDREDLLYGDSSKPLKSELDALQVFSVDADGSNEVFGSKLEGGMEDWIEVMLKKSIVRDILWRMGMISFLLIALMVLKPLRPKKN